MVLIFVSIFPVSARASMSCVSDWRSSSELILAADQSNYGANREDANLALKPGRCPRALRGLPSALRPSALQIMVLVTY